MTRSVLLALVQVVFLTAILAQNFSGQLDDITFVSSADGSEQKYIQILPENFDPDEEYNLIIGLHGHGSDRWQYIKSERPECKSFRTFVEKNGMIAICPDYRAKTSWMGPAAESDISQIIKESYEKYKIINVYMVGGSMGGTSALTYAAIHPEKIAGVTSMNGHANHFEYQNFQDAISESFGGSKDAIPEEYKKRSAEYWPERLTMPIAFTVGGKDLIVPNTSILRLAKVLKLLDRDVLLINNPDSGHITNFHEGMAALEFMLNASLKSK